MSPTQRSLKWCRDRAMTAFIVERWNHHSRIRQDGLGFIDLIYLDGTKTVACQTTSGSNVSARVAKIRAEKRARDWLESPHRMIVVHGWRKIGPRGKRKTWQLREVWLVLEDGRIVDDSE